MTSYNTSNIRNLALIGAPGTGKTLLIESLLHQAGAINSMGSIERGNTVCDYEPEEKTHKHSLGLAVTHFDHKGIHANLLDTPGFPDFMGHALCALEAVETAAVVIDSKTGVDLATRRMMDRAASRDLCRLIIVNKIDADPGALPGLLSAIQGVFGNQCMPINLPNKNATTVVDCFFNPSGDSDFSSVEDAHTHIIDQVVEVDEDLMAIYLEQGEELSPKQLHAPFEKALREGHLVPICFCSAETGAGIPELLDIVEQLMPNPGEGNPPVFLRGESDPERFHSSPEADKHVLAHVFRVTNDPFAGKMGVFRIYQGCIDKDSLLYVGDARKTFKVSHLFKLQGKDFVEIETGQPGDICAVSKVEEIHFDSVLHDDQDDALVHLEPMDFPQPMHGLALESRNRSDDQKISKALQMLSEEDPTILVERSAITNEVVVRGLGDIHLRLLLERMASKYGVEVDTHPPKIAYRETITAKAEGHHRHKKQTGGAGQFGEVFLRIEPLKRGLGFEFVNKVVGGTIPGQFIPAVEKGVRQVLDEGAVSGHPMQDVRVTIYEGKHHSVDSKEVAFVAAGKKAFQEAIAKAKPVLLEPLVDINISAPETSMGDITRDISGKRGQITGTEAGSGGMIQIQGVVPLGELADYQSRLKSVTGGNGSYDIHFSHYEIVPATLQKALLAEHKQGAS